MSNQFYIVQANESLATIALKFYGNKALWRRIYEANKDEIGSDPRLLRVGMNLRIPPLESDGLATTEPRGMELYSQDSSKDAPALLSLRVQNAVISDDYRDSENDQKTNGHTLLREQDKKEVAKERGWLKRFKINTSNINLGAWITGILGIALSLISLYKFVQERPKLNLLDPSVQLITPSSSDLISLYTKELEDLYGGIGGDLDDQLLDLIRQVNSSCESDSNDLDQNYIESGSFDFLQRSEKFQSTLECIKGEVDKVVGYYNSNDLKLDGSQQPILPSDKEHQGELKIIKDELTSIQQEINNVKSSNPLDSIRLAVFLTVENRSSLPNILRGRALFVVYDEQGSVLNLPLTVKLADEENSSDLSSAGNNPENGDMENAKEKINVRNGNSHVRSYTLPNNDAFAIELSSDSFYNVKPGTGSVMADVFAKEYKYLILIQDMNGRIWPTNGKLSNLNDDQGSKALQNEAETLIRKENHPGFLSVIFNRGS